MGAFRQRLSQLSQPIQPDEEIPGLPSVENLVGDAEKFLRSPEEIEEEMSQMKTMEDGEQYVKQVAASFNLTSEGLLLNQSEQPEEAEQVSHELRVSKDKKAEMQRSLDPADPLQKFILTSQQRE